MKQAEAGAVKVRRKPGFWSRAVKGFCETLYPSGMTCASCGREIFDGGVFCEKCLEDVWLIDGRHCEKCGMPTGAEGSCIRCTGKVNYFESAHSVFVYNERIKSALRRFKEEGCRYLAEDFAKLMYRYMKSQVIEADVLTFVPMTDERRKKRGYNQAEELAKELSKLSGLPCEEMFCKNLETSEQKDLSYEERQKNLQGRFRLTVRGSETRRVLLIDDVMTTGATVNECCRLLSKVCENGVKVLTFCTALRKIRMQ